MPKHYHNDYEAFPIKKPPNGGGVGTSTPISKQKDVHIKLEPLDVDDNCLDYDPLELPSTDNEIENSTAESSNHDKDESKTPDDDENDSKIFQKVQIIKVHPESLLKTSKIKVVDPLILTANRNDENIEENNT